VTHFFLWCLLLYLLSSSVFRFTKAGSSSGYSLHSWALLLPPLIVIISLSFLIYLFKPRYLTLAHFLEYDGSFQYLYYSFIGMVLGTALGVLAPFSLTVEKLTTQSDHGTPSDRDDTDGNEKSPNVNPWFSLPQIKALSFTGLALFFIIAIIGAPHFDRFLQSAREIGTSSFSIKMEQGDIFRTFDLTNLYLDNTVSTTEYNRRNFLLFNSMILPNFFFKCKTP